MTTWKETRFNPEQSVCAGFLTSSVKWCQARSLLEGLEAGGMPALVSLGAMGMGEPPRDSDFVSPSVWL